MESKILTALVLISATGSTIRFFIIEIAEIIELLKRLGGKHNPKVNGLVHGTRKEVMTQQIEFEDVKCECIKSNDLLFVDVLEPAKGARVTIVDVGGMLGFPGQILARIDYDNEILYGLAIQNAGSFKRKLLWKYKMASLKSAIALLIVALKAGLSIERRNSSLRNQPAPKQWLN